MVADSKGPLEGPWHITDHARDQYIEKWAPGLDRHAAFLALVRLTQQASLVTTYPDGQQRWRGPKSSGLRFIVDPRVAPGLRPALVTVLSPYVGDAEKTKPVGPVELPDFADVPGHPGKRSRLACRICQQPILTAGPRQSTCGKAECRSEHNTEVKSWRWITDPVYRERTSERWRAWAAEHKDDLRTSGAERMRKSRAIRRGEVVARPAPPDTWQAPTPDLGTHLPGAWRELVLTPAPHTPIPHSHAVSVHGMVSRAIGRDHDRTRADFVLAQAQVPSGWGVYFVDGADARRMSCAPMSGLHLEGRPWGIAFGQGVVVPRAPSGIVPGRYRVTLTTLSPVVIRRSADGKTLVRVMPTASSLRASLTGREFLRRIGLTEVPAWTRDACLVMVGHDTRRDSVDTDGHWNAGDGGGHGRVVGWSGSLDLEVNAVTLALLRCAEVVGLGGRVAVGFGCVRLSSVERQDAPSPHVP